MIFGIRGAILLVLATIFASCGPRPDPADVELAERYLSAIRAHADALLERGRDSYGKPTPFFVDGLDIETWEPVQWQYDDHLWTLSNFANQQELVRTLAGLSALTGDSRYHDAAVEVTRYVFDHLRTPNGLLLWGGHICYDAAGDQWAGRRFHWPKGKNEAIHELKSCYPFYELMWEVDPEATRQFIRGFWAAHMRDWSNLDFDRHGGVTKPKPKGPEMWDRPFDENAEVFFQGRGRTFVNAGSDLYFAAAALADLGKEEGALEWAKRLAGRYVATRNPETGLRGYQFSGLEVKDRAFAQFGDLFPDSFVREATLFDPNALPAPLLALLRSGERIGRRGEILKRWALEDLTAIGKTAYDESRGTFRFMLLDGTDLTDIPFPRDGYFGPRGTSFTEWHSADYFLVYATAARLADDSFMWEMARRIAKDAGHGDIGEPDGSATDLDPKIAISRPDHLVGMLELYHLTGNRAFLDHAVRIGDNILEQRFENDLFTPGPGYVYTRTSRPEPLALLHLAAALLKRPEAVPAFPDSDPYFACEHKSTDSSYTFDRFIYIERRE